VRRAPATVLVSSPPGYALTLPTAAVDAWHFDHRVRHALAGNSPEHRHRSLTEALDGWSGPPYLEVADASWAAPEVARLTELRLAAIEARADADLALGRPAAVVPDLERLLHDHPGREEAVRLLVLALYRGGRQGDALGTLRRARAYLADELGVDPGPALQALEADVLAQSPVLAPAAVPRSARHLDTPTAVSDGPTALGRGPELQAIAAAADEPGARIVWIVGEAGAGKTTLAEAALADLAGRGWRTLRGRCPEVAGAPPGWAWSEILGGDLNGGDLNVGDRTPFHLGNAVADALDAKTVVLLEDAHRADDLTLQLLRQVLSRRDLLVLATYRGSDVGDELAATIDALLAATAAHLRLEGLDAPAVAALARRHGIEDPATVAMLAERTGGNPLFVRELARLIAAEGTSAARTAVPTGVREVLRRRVARLPGATTTALRQAAVLGRDVDVDLLARVARRSGGDLFDALETAVLAGLLDEPVPGRVRFAHALVRDTLYDDTPLLRRTRLHTAALTELSGTGDAATLAYHAAAAAGPANAHEAVPYVVAAARDAEAVGAWGEAARQWTSALRLHELAERHPGGAADRRAALVGLLTPAVTALARSGDTTRARELYVKAAALSPDVLCAWDAPLIWSTRPGGPDDHILATARALLDEQLLDEQPDDATAARLHLAVFRETEGVDVPAAIAATEAALSLARRVDDPRLLCAALNARAYVALGPDLVAERRPVAEELLRVAAASGQTDHEAVAHWLLFLESASRADLPGALAEVASAVERAGTGQLGQLLSVVAIFGALLELLAGRPDEALARYETVSRQLTEHGAVHGGLMATVGRISVAMARGDLSPVCAEMVEIDRLYPKGVTDALVLSLLDAGRVDEARAAWAGRADVARDYYWLAWTTMRGHAAARLGDLDAARSLYADLLPFAGRVAGLDSGTLNGGPVDEALAALADALGRPAAASAHREAAAGLRVEVAAALKAG
jgi:tetratricopeptide (TPR) repeat protein